MKLHFCLCILLTLPFFAKSETNWVPVSVGDITIFIPYTSSELLPAPSNVRITTNDTTVLTWDEVQHASKYEVQGLNSNGVWVRIIVTENTSIIIDDSFNAYSKFRVLACGYNTCHSTGNWSVIERIHKLTYQYDALGRLVKVIGSH